MKAPYNNSKGETYIILLKFMKTATYFHRGVFFKEVGESNH